MPQLCYYYFLGENNKKISYNFKLTNIVSTALSVNCEVPEQSESVRQVFFILLLNFQKYKIQQQVHIYIYIYISRDFFKTAREAQLPL